MLAITKESTSKKVRAKNEVSHKKAAILGLQHLLAMYSGAIAVPLLIGAALKFNSTHTVSYTHLTLPTK